MVWLVHLAALPVTLIGGWMVDLVRRPRTFGIVRFQLALGDANGPLPLACAMRWAEAALAGPPASGDAGRAATRTRADVVLLFAAALDGRAQTAGLAEAAGVPAPSAPEPSECADGLAALGATADLMSDARQS